VKSLRRARGALNGRVAFVPTMGALHAGHMALITAAQRCADHVIVSIFVNPLQFGAGEDLTRYPRQEAQDAALLAAAGVAILWLPTVETMVPAGFVTQVSAGAMGDALEGVSRPGHFNGVATIVTRLFGQIRPDSAIFGEKDWQQLQIVRRITSDLDLDIDIVGVPILRDADGLALSSRNVYLNADERRAAPALPQALHTAARDLAAGADLIPTIDRARVSMTKAGFCVDYIELMGNRLLAAARIGNTRLIDNVALS
jgi:pantoate--beta-alanine ligase